MADPSQWIYHYAGSTGGSLFCWLYGQDGCGGKWNGKCAESGLLLLGGIFVPLEMLTGVVRRIGQFFPTYWYAQNISILSFNETLTDSLKTTLFQGMGIQILFALACVAVALAIGRAKRQEE